MSPVVQIPGDCEAVLQPVMVPPVKAGDDARAALARRSAALASANRKLDEGRGCIVNQRRLYEAAK